MKKKYLKPEWFYVDRDEEKICTDNNVSLSNAYFTDPYLTDEDYD